MILGNLVTRFTADLTDLKAGVSQYGKEIGTAEKKSEDFSAGLAGMATKLTAVAAVITAVAYAVYKTVQGYGSFANQLKDLSYQTGVSTENLQKLQYAATLSGTDFSRVSFGLNQLSISMAEAADASSAAYKSFAGLGIDTSGKSVEDVFEAVSVALSKMEDKTRRNQIAQQLFGRSYKELLPFMESYIKNQREIEQHEVLSKDDLKTLEEGKRVLDGMVTTLELFAAKAVVAAEKAAGLGKEITKMRAPESTTESRTGQYQEQFALMEERFGPLNARQGGPAANPYEGMSAKEAERKYTETVTIPALEKRLDYLRQGGGSAEEVAEASLKLLQARESLLEDETTQQEKLNDAQQDYLDVARKINDEKKDQATTTREYIMDMQSAGGDVSQQRSLTLGYKKSMLRSKDELSDLGGDLQTAAYRTIAAQRGDTDMSSSLSLSIENVNLSKDYPIEQFIKGYESYVSQQRRQKGVRS